MSTRYILVNTIEQIETRFELPQQHIIVTPNYNISVSHMVPIIMNDNPKQIQFFKLGLTPFWAKREMLLINARAEGDANKDDRPDFKGSKGIIQKPAFRKPIRSQRCLVIASAFIVGVEGERLSKPYLVYLRNHKNPFAMAGIWDTWINPADGKIVNSFSIITSSANSLMHQIGQHRMPVILSDMEEKKWINLNTDLSRITAMLIHYDSNLMNAYPIDARFKDPAENGKQLIEPIGDKILFEDKFNYRQTLNTSGWYHHKKRPSSNEPTTTMAERIEQSKAKEKQ